MVASSAQLTEARADRVATRARISELELDIAAHQQVCYDGLKLTVHSILTRVNCGVQLLAEAHQEVAQTRAAKAHEKDAAISALQADLQRMRESLQQSLDTDSLREAEVQQVSSSDRSASVCLCVTCLRICVLILFLAEQQFETLQKELVAKEVDNTRLNALLSAARTAVRTYL